MNQDVYIARRWEDVKALVESDGVDKVQMVLGLEHVRSLIVLFNEACPASQASQMARAMRTGGFAVQGMDTSGQRVFTFVDGDDEHRAIDESYRLRPDVVPQGALSMDMLRILEQGLQDACQGAVLGVCYAPDSTQSAMDQHRELDDMLKMQADRR